jgi:DNA-binding CsgD family transcriptional regulator
MPDTTQQPTTYYTSERAWLDHLRIMAELPYPSRAMLTGIAEVLRAHFDWDLISFGWDERATMQPLAYWAEPIVGEILQHYVENFSKFAQEVPLQAMFDSNGHLLRMAENSPEYEQSSLYQNLLEPYGVRWGMASMVYLGESEVGFFGLFRQRERGPYSDAEQARLDKAALALGDLDRRHNPLAALPEPGSREALLASMLLNRAGNIQALSRNARNILFLARYQGMGPPDWARSDKQALPPEVARCIEDMFAAEDRVIDEVQLRLPWGSFDFVLEKMELLGERPETVINIIIRHHEPLDIAVARALWGWPFSPQEKRILIASARNPSLAQLAEALGLTVGTLKHYINVLQGKLGASSRQEIIERVLAAT